MYVWNIHFVLWATCTRNITYQTTVKAEVQRWKQPSKGLFTRRDGYPSKQDNHGWRANDSPGLQARFHTASITLQPSEGKLILLPLKGSGDNYKPKWMGWFIPVSPHGELAPMNLS